MELTCSLCDSKNEIEETRVKGLELTCAVCGEPLKLPLQLSAPVRPTSRYDGYNVGRRVLKLAPGWLLLSLAGFVLLFLLFGWLTRPVVRKGEAEEEFRNEALNQTPARQPTPDAHRAVRDSSPPAETPSHAAAPAEEAGTEDAETTPAPQESSVEEDETKFAVQIGSFDDRSQANEQVSRVRAAGFEARVVETRKEKTEGVWYQVRCGRFATRDEAARLAAQLRAKGLIEKAVIVEPAQ